MLPHIIPLTLDEEVNVGDSVQLNCHVSKGDRPLNISWSFKGAPLEGSSGSGGALEVVRMGDRSSILTITSAGAEHSGSYTCTASNRAGSASLQAPVHVNGSLPVTDDFGSTRLL